MSIQGFHVLEEFKFTRNASFAVGYGHEVGDGEVWAVREMGEWRESEEDDGK